MSCGLIYFESGLKMAEQNIFLRRTLKQCETELVTEGKRLLLFRLPVSTERPSERAVFRFIDFLKNKGIKKVYLHEIPKKFAGVIAPIYREFEVFDGFSVINYALYDIIRKYAAQKGMILRDVTLVLHTDAPQKAEHVISLLHRHVHRISIQTSDFERFEALTAHFLNEYGIYIAMYGKKECKNEFHIVLDEARKADLCDLNLTNGNLSVYFNMKQYFKELLCFGKCKQDMIEFLCYMHENSLSNAALSSFFKAYAPKISKIKNND